MPEFWRNTVFWRTIGADLAVFCIPLKRSKLRNHTFRWSAKGHVLGPRGISASGGLLSSTPKFSLKKRGQSMGCPPRGIHGIMAALFFRGTERIRDVQQTAHDRASAHFSESPDRSSKYLEDIGLRSPERARRVTKNTFSTLGTTLAAAWTELFPGNLTVGRRGRGKRRGRGASVGISRRSKGKDTHYVVPSATDVSGGRCLGSVRRRTGACR